jgi:nitrate/nitrite transport system substrate-binding protein
MKTIKLQITKVTKSVLILLLVISAAFATIRAQNEPVKLGFIPLTDCSPIVMAKELGLFKKYGVEVVVTKESSWANIRDKILTGGIRRRTLFIFDAVFSLYWSWRKSWV